MTGVFVAQLLVLQQAMFHPPPSSSTLSFLSIGKPLATAFFSLAVVTVALGAGRAFAQQSAMIRGVALVGGPELVGIGAAILMVSGILCDVCDGAEVRALLTWDSCF